MDAIKEVKCRYIHLRRLPRSEVSAPDLFQTMLMQRFSKLLRKHLSYSTIFQSIPRDSTAGVVALYLGTSSLNHVGKKPFYDIISVLGFNQVESGGRPLEGKSVVSVNCQCSGWTQVGFSGRGNEGCGKTSFLSGQQ